MLLLRNLSTWCNTNASHWPHDINCFQTPIQCGNQANGSLNPVLLMVGSCTLWKYGYLLYHHHWCDHCYFPHRNRQYHFACFSATVTSLEKLKSDQNSSFRAGIYGHVLMKQETDISEKSPAEPFRKSRGVLSRCFGSQQQQQSRHPFLYFDRQTHWHLCTKTPELWRKK